MRSGYASWCKECQYVAKKRLVRNREYPSTSVRVVCPHCGLVNKGRVHGEEHVVQCPHNPEIEGRFRAYLREHAVDGIIMRMDEYDRACVGSWLPSKRTLEHVFGPWSAVAKWAGLGWRRPAAVRVYAPPVVHVTVAELDATLPGGYTVGSVREVGNRVYMMLR